MAKKKVILPKIKSKPKYTIELDEEQMYSLGGWLQENAAPLLTTAAGAVMTATGVGAGAGIPMMVSGAAGLAGNAFADDPEVIDYSKDNRQPRTVGKQNMTPNVMSFAMGGSHKMPDGSMMKDKLMQLKGPKHEEGGIQFTPDAELEGDESVYKDIVNSDRIKITKEIATKYGLPKVAINKTPAEYSDLIEKNYKGREVDPFAQTGKEMELNNLAKMSSEIAEQYKSNANEYAIGGGLKATRAKNPITLKSVFVDPTNNFINSAFNTRLGEGIDYTGQYQNNQYVDPSTPYTDWKDPNYLSQDNILQRNRELYNNKINRNKYGLESRSRLDRYTTKDIPIKGKVNLPTVVNPSGPNVDNFAEGQILNIKDPTRINLTGNPFEPFKVPNIVKPDVTPNTLMKSTLPNIKSTDIKNIPDVSKEISGTDILGLAPLAMGAFQAARTSAEGYDKVKLGRIHAEDYNPEFIDPKYQLDQVSDAFATGNEQMNQVSRKDFLRRRIQSATEEAKTKSGVLGQVSAANIQMLNQSKQINNQNRMNADRVNLEVGMQEENINAANKGAWQTARDYQLNNLASMAGEYARDQKLTDANETYNDRMFGTMKNLYPGQTYDPATGQWINTGAPLATEDTSSVNMTSNNSWKYNSGSVYGDDIELGQGLNSYPNQVNRMVNGYRLPNVSLNRPIR